jgi:hypothetical protein
MIPSSRKSSLLPYVTLFLLYRNPINRLSFTSALYLKNDPYETSDAVFGVKNTLVVELGRVTDEIVAKQYGVKVGCALMEYDFVLVTKDEALNLRYENAVAAMLSQGRKMEYINGLPVPEVD